MSDLTEFLLARFDDDATDASGVHDIGLCDRATRGVLDPTFGWECTCGWPARVLAEVEAKRRIVALHPQFVDQEFSYCETCERSTSPCDTLRALALPYRDHADFDPEWAV